MFAWHSFFSLLCTSSSPLTTSTPALTFLYSHTAHSAPLSLTAKKRKGYILMCVCVLTLSRVLACAVYNINVSLYI